MALGEAQWSARLEDDLAPVDVQRQLEDAQRGRAHSVAAVPGPRHQLGQDDVERGRLHRLAQQAQRQPFQRLKQVVAGRVRRHNHLASIVQVREVERNLEQTQRRSHRGVQVDGDAEQFRVLSQAVLEGGLSNKGLVVGGQRRRQTHQHRRRVQRLDTEADQFHHRLHLNVTTSAQCRSLFL